MYTEALETSADAMGTLQHQQDIYMESTDAKLQRLRTTWQGLYDDLIDTDEINAGIDALTDAVQVFDNFVSSFGGGLKTISGFGAIVANIFSKQIANGINDAIQRQKIFQNNLNLAKLQAQVRTEGVSTEGTSVISKAVQAQSEIELKYAQQIYNVRHGLTQEQYTDLLNKQKQIGELEKEYNLINANAEKIAENINKQKIFGQDTEKIVNSLREGNTAEVALGELIERNNAIYHRQEQTLEKINQHTREINAARSLSADDSGQIQKVRKIAQSLRGSLQSTFDTAGKSMWESLSESEQRVLNNATKIDNVTNHYKKTLGDIQKILNTSSNLIERERTKIEGQTAAAERLEEAERGVYEARINRQEVTNEADDMIKTAEGASNLTAKITMLTSSVGNLAMAWSTVSSLMTTWTDDSLSFGDKILQSLTALGIAIPITISSFKQLNDIFGMTLSSGLSVNAMEVAHTATIEASNKVKEAQLALDAAIETDDMRGNVIRSAQITLENAETDSIRRQNAEKSLSILTSKGNYTAKLKEVIAILAHKSALDADTQAAILNKAAMLGVIGVIAAVAAGIAIATKAVENWHKIQVQDAEDKIKSAKETQEVIKANQELVKSYDEVYKKYKETGEGKDELLKSSFELIDAYGIENGRILALSNQYDELNKRIKEKIQNELEDQKVSAKTGAVGAAKKAAEAASTGGGSTLFAGTGNYKTNLSLLNTLSENGNNYAFDQIDSLKQLREQFGTENNIINYEDDPQRMMDYINLINESLDYISALPKEQKESFKDVYDYLLEEQGQLAEAATELKEQLDLMYSADVQLQFIDFDFEKANLDDLYTKISEVKENLKGAIPDDQIDDFVNNYLNGIEGIETNIEKINIAKKFAEQIDEGIHEVLSKIENFNEGQLGYLALHLNTAILDGDLNQWLEDHKDIIEAYGKVASSDTFKNMISNYDKDNGFTQQQQDNLYDEDSSTAEYMPVSQSEFSIMDQSQQLSVVTAAWIENTKAVVDNKETIVGSLQEEINSLRAVGEATDDSGKTLSDRGAEAIRSIDELINKSETYKGRSVEVKEAIIALSEDGYDNLDSNQEAVVDTLSKYEDVSQDQLKTYGKQIKEAEEYDDQLNALIEEQERIQKATADYDGFIQQLNADQAQHGAIMDDIQSAYQSLISIVDSYNKTGAFTIDQVQQLMTMDDAYVSTLQFENGQLILNDQAFQNLTIAKINDMEQTAIATAAEQLEALAHQNSADAAIQNGQATSWAATMAREGAKAAMEGAAAWTAYANSMRAAANVTDSKYDAKAKEITDALQARLQAAENAKTQIRSGGVPMRTAMGVSPSKSGGGGGGGGGSSQEAKDEKHIKDEIDTLHALEKQLETIERRIDRLAKAREHLRGIDLRSALKQESKLLDQQIKQYNKLINEEKRLAGIDKGKLKNVGAKFDDNNNITNYAKVQKNIQDQYNKAVDTYNQSGKSEADKTTLDNAKKLHDELLKNLDSYEDHVKNIEKYRDDKEDARIEKRAKNLERWETRFQIKLDKRQAQREWNGLKKIIDTDIKKVFKDYSLEAKNAVKDTRTFTNDKNNGTIDLTFKEIERVQAEIDKLSSKGKSNMFDNVDQAQSRLQELWDQVTDQAQELQQLWQDAWSAYIDGIDQSVEKFQTLQDQFDRLNDTLEYQTQLVELIYGEESYDRLGNLYQDQFDTTIGQIKSLKTESEMWFNLLDKRMKENGHTMDDIFSWDEDEVKFYQNWQNALEKINDKNLQAIQFSKQIYQNTINENMKQLEKDLLGGSTLEEVQYEWERARKEADKYFDSAEKTYQIETLANKMDKEINATNNLKVQQRLMKIRNQEIDMLREKDKLTDYDVKKAELRYQLELKQIALEDSRNNKTSMKLTRNDQGNWSYQYVANEDDVIDKQQALLDVWNELYQLEDEYYVKSKEDMISATSEYLESVRKIEEARMNNLISEQEKIDNLSQLYTDYTSDMQELSTGLYNYETGLQVAEMGLTTEAYKQDLDAFYGMTEKEKAMVVSLKNANAQTYEEYKQIVEGKFDEFLKNKEEHYRQEAIAAGLSEEEIEGYVATRMKETKDQLDDVKKKSDEVMDETKKDWDDKTHEMSKLWNDNPDSVKHKIEDAYDNMNTADRTFRDQVDETADASGQDFDNVGAHVGSTKSEVDDLVRATQKLASDTETATTDMQRYIREVEIAWDKVKDQIIQAKREFDKYVKDIKDTGNLETEHTIKIKYVYETEGEPPSDTGGKTGKGGGGSGSGTGSGENRTGTIIKEDKEQKKGGTTNSINNVSLERIGIDYSEGTSEWAYYPISTSGTKADTAFNTEIVQDTKLSEKDKKKKIKEWLAKYGGRPVSYDTGGYTGSWGNSGRLAMLHEKELILNKQDTANFLSGINMIRDMTALNGSISNAIMRAMTNTAISLSGLKPGTISGGTTNSNTENVFNITAEFPNAENVNDIREAILSLPNIAAQYANQHKL